MSASTLVANGAETLADLVHQLGDIPLHRIRMQPPPGTATEDDLIAACESREKRLCELVDGILVEKDMGALESFLAGYLLRLIGNFMEENDLGIPFGADGPFRILSGRIRLPDVSVCTWETLGVRKIPKEKVLSIAPDLAIEVVSEGNTPTEIDRKIREYFQAGVKQAWVIYPKTETARRYTSADKYTRISRSQALTGGNILPGFRLPLAKLFERVEKPKKRKR